MVSAKYIKENEFEVANITIDRKEPEIEVIKINNNNKDMKNMQTKHMK